MICNEQRARDLAPTLAGVGFEVGDPAAAADRARALQAPAVHRRTLATEQDLPAFRAPDGTEVFLAAVAAGDASWVPEFEGGQQPPAAGLLTRVDHVNLAQPWQCFDEAVLFYSSVLGLTSETSQDVPALNGLVRSQVVRAEGGDVRLALNVAPLVWDHRGSFPQHVAFATDDVVTVARNAIARGLIPLAIPLNYYDDLRARFDLPPDQVRLFAELGLLYDRDGAGDFTHFYTATVGGVFLEVVQRRGGYDGDTGAPNLQRPARAAARGAGAGVHREDRNRGRAAQRQRPRAGGPAPAEGDASPADVFLTENSPAMSSVERAGLFAPLDEEALAPIPEQYRPASGLWTGFAARSTVLVYNTDLVQESELPDSILDLAEPEWAGRISFSPTGADFQAIVSAVLLLEGEEATAAWLDGLKANGTVYDGNNVVLESVNAGESDLGIIYHYYWYRDQAESGEVSDNTQLYFFGNQDPGAFVSVSGAGVLKSAEHPDEAQQFVAFLTSEEGQQLLADSYALEYPLNPAVQLEPPVKPFDELEPPVVPISDLDGEKVVEMMTEAGFL